MYKYGCSHFAYIVLTPSDYTTILQTSYGTHTRNYPLSTEKLEIIEDTLRWARKGSHSKDDTRLAIGLPLMPDSDNPNCSFVLLFTVDKWIPSRWAVKKCWWSDPHTEKILLTTQSADEELPDIAEPSTSSWTICQDPTDQFAGQDMFVQDVQYALARSYSAANTGR